MDSVTTILLPTRPQPDTVVAIFLLRTFGKEKYPSIDSAKVEIAHTLAPGETFQTLVAKGIVALDVGGGPLDHHGRDYCTSELVAKHLGVERNPSLARLLQYARRDDREGKGTISTDAIDRAFGLSGLIASLNKAHSTDPQKVVDTVLPLLEAHYISAREHHVELPREVEQKKHDGMYEEAYVEQSGKKLKISFVISDKPSMPTFLRSQHGPRADIVVQKSEGTNHMCILSRQERNIDLSKVAALIRLREGQLRGVDLGNDPTFLGKTGRIDEVAHWYFDPATNSLLNGGAHNTTIEESGIQWDEMKKIVQAGIEIGGVKASPTPTRGPNASYYLSINIPSPQAQEIVSNVEASEKVKVHAANNLHITLEYFGQKTPEEISTLVNGISTALKDKHSFELEVRDTHLAVGQPEGYSHAWYLNVPEESGAPLVQQLRDAILTAIGLELRQKMLHITLATKRGQGEVPDFAVTFTEPFRVMVPVTEVVLMENAEVNGKRIYRAHTTFPLT